MVWYDPRTWLKKSSPTSPQPSTNKQESVKTTIEQPQKLGVVVTDFTTGESVKTETSNNNTKISKTYSPSPPGGKTSRRKDIGKTEALRQTEESSRIGSTAAILEIKPVTTVTQTSRTVNGGREITTTTTQSYDLGKLKGKELVSFETPTGYTSLALSPTDRLGVNSTGDISSFPQGSTLPKGYVPINTQGERLYGSLGFTSSELLTYAKDKSKLAGAGLIFGSAFTPINPLGLNQVFNMGSLGLNKISGGKIGISSSEYATRTENIQKNTLAFTTENKLGSFLIKSPVVQTAAVPLAFGAVGGVLKQTSLAVTTIPSIATKTVPFIAGSSSFLASSLGGAVSYGVPLLVNAQAKNIENKSIYYEKMGVSDKLSGSFTGLTMTGIEYYGATKGLTSGLKEGLPLVARGVQVDGQTVSQGLYFQYSGKPIYTKTATGYSSSGDLTFTKGFGMPQKIVYPLTRSGPYTPSGAVETTLYRQYIKTNSVQGVGVENAYGVTSFTYNKPSKFFDTDYAKTFFKKSGFKSETSQALNKYFKGQSGYEIYGSTPTKAQLPGYRTPKDLDVAFYNSLGKTKANEIISIINKYEGGNVARLAEGSTGQILVNNVKKFDIHGYDTPAEFSITNSPFGFDKLKPVNVGGLSSSRLSQEGVNKLSSIGSLQTSGVVSPDMVKRGKDIADFYYIQKGLIEQSGGKGSVTAAVQLTGYKEGAVNYFGAKVFSNYPKIVGYSSSSTSSTSVLTPSIGSSGNSYPVGVPLIPYSSGGNSYNSEVPIKPYTLSTNFKSRSSTSTVIRSSGSGSYSYTSPSFSSSPVTIVSTSGSYRPSPPSPPPISSYGSSSPSYSSYSISPSPSSYSSSYVPSSPTTIIIPPIYPVGGVYDSLISNVFKGGNKKTAYQPSFRALLFKEKGTYKAGKLSKSGLDYRPITSGYSINKGFKSFLGRFRL